MAASMAVTERKIGTVHKIRMEWVSGPAGVSIQCGGNYDGALIAVMMEPGTEQPNDLYDIEIQDDHGADLLHGNGANLTNAAATYKAHADGLGTLTGSDMALKITNSGNAKTGVVEVWIR